MEPGQANFILRDSLLQFLKDFPEVAMQLAQQLSRNYYTAYEEIRTLGLVASPLEKFAKLLLSWSTSTTQNDGSTQVKLTLTHEEICGNGWDNPGNRQQLILRVQEEKVAATERRDPPDPQSDGSGEDRPALISRRSSGSIRKPSSFLPLWTGAYVTYLTSQCAELSAQTGLYSLSLEAFGQMRSCAGVLFFLACDRSVGLASAQGVLQEQALKAGYS